MRIRSLTNEDAHLFATWRYPEPYSIYDSVPDDARRFLDPLFDYQAVEDEHGALIAFCCFGPDAQVPGGPYGAGAVDLGVGLRPDLLGRGLGRALLAAMIAHVEARYPEMHQRLTVAAFNERALRLARSAGFEETHRFRATNERGQEFVILERS